MVVAVVVEYWLGWWHSGGGNCGGGNGGDISFVRVEVVIIVGVI